VNEVKERQGKLFLAMKEAGAPSEQARRAKKAPASPEEVARFEEFVGGDHWISARVTSVVQFGFFADVSHPSGEGKPVNALLHKSELRDTFVEDLSTIASVGDEIRVRITACDAESGKMALSMRENSVERREKPRGRSDEPQDLSEFADLSPDTWLTGTVTSLHNFGIFMEVLPPNTDGGQTGTGLVHISEVADGFVQDVAELYEVGQTLQVRVLDADQEKGRLSLSLIDAKPEQDESQEEESGAEGGD
jgi:predicted RNA-binding protein with RPS1 domain